MCFCYIQRVKYAKERVLVKSIPKAGLQPSDSVQVLRPKNWRFVKTRMAVQDPRSWHFYDSIRRDKTVKSPSSALNAPESFSFKINPIYRAATPFGTISTFQKKKGKYNLNNYKSFTIVLLLFNLYHNGWRLWVTVVGLFEALSATWSTRSLRSVNFKVHERMRLDNEFVLRKAYFPT